MLFARMETLDALLLFLFPSQCDPLRAVLPDRTRKWCRWREREGAFPIYGSYARRMPGLLQGACICVELQHHSEAWQRDGWGCRCRFGCRCLQAVSALCPGPELFSSHPTCSLCNSPYGYSPISKGPLLYSSV